MESVTLDVEHSVQLRVKIHKFNLGQVFYRPKLTFDDELAQKKQSFAIDATHFATVNGRTFATRELRL